MIKTIERAHWDLTRLGAEDEMGNSTIISLIEQRMPYRMKEDWAESIAEKSNLQGGEKFSQLLKFLSKTRSKLEYMSDTIRSTPITQEVKAKSYHVEGSPNSEGRNKTFYTDSKQFPRSESNTYTKNVCWIHPEMDNHPIWRCREFHLLPVDESVKIVIDNKAYNVCLKADCPDAKSPQTCKTNFRCRKDGCTGNHNRLLHGAKAVMSGAAFHLENEPAATGNTILQIQQA